MPKQAIAFNFQKGLDTKNDPWQIELGNFLRLENMVFSTPGQLKKRNGYANFTSIPEAASFLTTFNGNLTAIGSSLQAFGEGSKSWVNKGDIQPLELKTLPLIRSNTNQSQIDAVVSSNNYVCTVYTDQTPTAPATPRYMFAVADVTTGQNIINPTVITPTSGSVNGSPRVFLLGAYFIVAFPTTTNHLQYIAISTANPSMIKTAADISTSISNSASVAWDAVTVGNHLYFAFNSTSGGQSIKITYLSSTLSAPVSPVVYSDIGKVTATMMSVTVDTSNSSAIRIWAAYYDSVSQDGYAVAIDQNLSKILITPAQIISSEDVANITSVATGNILTAYYEINNNYTYDSSIPTHYIKSVTCTITGTVGTPVVVVRSVGLASKAFVYNGETYFLAAYDSTYQPSYFLINSIGQVISKLAYSNGGGYDSVGLPGITITDNIVQVGYLIKDFITSQNTSQTESLSKSNIYSQTGLNLATLTIGTSNISPVEIGKSLHLTGGFLWQYDGYQPVEHNFFLWPDDVEGTPHNTGGAMVPQEYRYQAVYTWTDNQGNIHNSAPSIATVVDMSTANKSFIQPTPITFTANLTLGSKVLTSVSSFTGIKVGQILTDTTTGANLQANSYIQSFDSGAGTITLNLPATATSVGDTISTSSICSVTVNVPTLRLTYKLSNPVKVQIFRWSTAQQIFYQVTSIQSPLINDTTVDSISYVDTQADNQIFGNSIIYTEGGVIENIGAPSFNSLTLFDNRLWGINAEDPNQLWFSKQVIQNTPVEMSDLFTLYVPPSTAAQGSTGDMKCLFPMDDALIIFKANAIYYINGSGPDNLGVGSQYSPPIFITSTVGTINQQSICMTDSGLLFQSDKGYWLLMRSKQQCAYLGAAVEEFTLSGTSNSALTIPETTQIRTTMSSGVTLMMDYFNNNQWGTFTGVPAISSTLYENSHTYLDRFGRIFKETPDTYLDGTAPVLMSFQTGWINAAGISGYERIYELIILGKFLSPCNIVVNIAYDFRNPTQQSIITPTNYTGVYGSDDLYGQTSPFGGIGPVLQWRIQTEQQKCQVFQLTIEEQFNSSYGAQAGAGFTLTGITGVILVKKGYRPINAATSVG